MIPSRERRRPPDESRHRQLPCVGRDETCQVIVVDVFGELFRPFGRRKRTVEENVSHGLDRLTTRARQTIRLTKDAVTVFPDVGVSGDGACESSEDSGGMIEVQRCE